ncbi:MAG: hypothetical protein ABW186_17290 [Rhodanobacteraceae bacterium]
MDDLWLWLGRIAGALGIVTCAVGVLVRLGGAYVVGGFQTGTLLIAGTTALVAGCWFLLLAQTRRR